MPPLNLLANEGKHVYRRGGYRRKSERPLFRSAIGRTKKLGERSIVPHRGCIEVAQRMAGYSNAKTTGVYDRRTDDVSVSEVERIGI